VSYLVLSRHVVGVGVVVLTLPSMLWGRFSLEDWLVVFFALLLFAAVGTGLMALFFTRREAAKSARNFVLLLWVFTGLTMLGTPRGERLLSLLSRTWMSESATSVKEFNQFSPQATPNLDHPQEWDSSGPKKGYFDDTQKCDPNNAFADLIPACREFAGMERRVPGQTREAPIAASP
jgi:hypothetical protein